MSSPQTVPVIAPDGSGWDIPQENVPSALKSGGKLGVSMTAPDSSNWLIPMDRVHDAINAGGKLTGVQPISGGGMSVQSIAQKPQSSWSPEEKQFMSDQLDQRVQQTAEDYEKSFPMALGGGLQTVGAKAAAVTTESLAKRFAQRIYQHLSNFLGLDEEATAEGTSAAKEATAPKEKLPVDRPGPNESPTEFSQRQSQGRATIKLPPEEPTPAEEGETDVTPKLQTVDTSGNGNANKVPWDALSKEAKQKALDDFYAKHPEQKSQPKIVQRVRSAGQVKGQVKTYRVFDNGKWESVPVYEVPKAK